MRSKTDLSVYVLWLLTLPWMVLALWMVFQWVPDARHDVEAFRVTQRIFYFHVPMAVVTYAAIFTILGGAIGYMWTGRPGWDHLALAATETALLGCTLVLITGPIWARPIWNAWWTWEARLTTTLVLWLLLIGGLMVRSYADSRELGARLSAIVAIAAVVDIFLIRKAVELWGGMHPTVFKAGQPDSLAPEMLKTLMVCMGVVLLLFTLILLTRTRLAQLEERVEIAAERLGD